MSVAILQRKCEGEEIKGEDEVCGGALLPLLLQPHMLLVAAPMTTNGRGSAGRAAGVGFHPSHFKE
jgi:hypothetical protein